MRTLDPLVILDRLGLDLARPFTTRDAYDAGLSSRQLAAVVEGGLLTRPLRGVYVAAHLPLTLELRVACVALVVPEGGVVTDRTAGWLHGSDMTLAPGDHLEVPPVSVFLTPGNRLCNQVTASGERRLLRGDVTEVGGLRVTTPLRTACDLGRLLHRDSALAALDSMLRVGGLTADDLLLELDRFKGYRGVKQLRVLGPLADPGSQSFGESALRLRWYDAGGLPCPETQIPVALGLGRQAFLDLGTREWRYAAEYDGAEFHGPEHEDHDRERRAALAEEGWTVDVFTRREVFGRDQNATAVLRTNARLAALRAR